MVKIQAYDPNYDSEHFNKLQDAYLSLFNEKCSLRYLSFTGIDFNPRIITGFLKNSQQDEIEYFVALSSDNNIIGVSAFKTDLINGFEVIGTVVDKNYRCKSVGRALINEGINSALNKGFKAVDISVFADNTNMLILLLKIGFKLVKIEYHMRFDGEDLIHLKKYL